MNICFFNLTEPAGEKVGNGVVRVAATLAVVLRERGHRVEFYAAPPKSTLTKLGVSAGTHFRNFLRERKIDVAVWQMGSCRVPFSLKNLPCRLIAVWHNAPNFRNEDYALRLCEKYKIRARPLRRIFLSRLAGSAIRCVYEIYPFPRVRLHMRMLRQIRSAFGKIHSGFSAGAGVSAKNPRDCESGVLRAAER